MTHIQIPLGVLEQQPVPPPGCVVSIEKVSAYLNASSTTVSVDLTKGQDYSKCIPILATRGYHSGSSLSNAVYWAVGAELWDNSGTPAIRFTRGTITADVQKWMVCYVIEFNDDITVQQIPITISGTLITKNVACSTVDQSRAFAFTSFYSTNWSYPPDGEFRVYFTSDTNVQLDRGLSRAGALTGYVYVVEDVSTAAPYHFNVQNLTGSSGTTINNTIDLTIPTPVDFGSTMLVSSMCSSSSITATTNNLNIDFHLVDEDTVQLRTLIGPYDKDYSVFVVEWTDGTSVQRGFFSENYTTAAAAHSTNIALGTAVDTDKSFGHWTITMNWSNNLQVNQNNVSSYYESMAVIDLVAGGGSFNVIRQTTTTSLTASAYWEVIQVPKI